MKLGTLLLRNATIGLAQLEAALRNQVLYGGRLGTNLVELGFLDLEQLSTYLAELTGLPVATPTLLDDADRTLLDTLGADEAHRLRAVPLGMLETGDAAVAIVDPGDEHAMKALAQRLGTKDRAVRRAGAARPLLPREAFRHAAPRALHPDGPRWYRPG